VRQPQPLERCRQRSDRIPSTSICRRTQRQAKPPGQLPPALRPGCILRLLPEIRVNLFSSGSLDLCGQPNCVKTHPFSNEPCRHSRRCISHAVKSPFPMAGKRLVSACALFKASSPAEVRLYERRRGRPSSAAISGSSQTLSNKPAFSILPRAL